MPALPTGTVTFLFTDIEGSTRLWEEQPATMREALARHDALIEAGVEQHGGLVVRPRGEGDSRFAVFSRASDAVTAAAAIQQALQAEAWATPVPLRARMALHTGEADLREGDYYGSAVNRCARLRAIAHGGQTLLSQATCVLVHDSLPAGVSLRDLGEHRMSDLQRPEQVFQVQAGGLTAEFPPLRSLDVIPNNLPLQLTSFVGREGEMGEVTRLLAGTRLLTLTGPGGTGKTRLALQVAADLPARYPQGVWLVELARLADAALVPQAVATVLGVQEDASRPLVAALTEVLRPKHLLLVLDNCEHLIDACAQLAEALLRGCAHVNILATSREALGIAGEMAWRVPSLALPDPRHLPPCETLIHYEAVHLFVDRAVAVQPQFAVTNHNAPAVAQLCRRLDGIPLAIELAAARVRGLSVEQLAARLDQRFRLLTGGSRTALPRQQTLQAMVDWSYGLLSAPEQTLFTRLSVFSGGFTLEAAETVCAGAPITVEDVLDLLLRLIDKSLIVAEDGADGIERYRLLETLRQYGRERLIAGGIAAALHEQHAAYFLALAEQASPALRGPEHAAWLQRLEREHDNLRAALAWWLGAEGQTGQEDSGARTEAGLRLAGALWAFWFYRGYRAEGLRWLEQALGQEGGTAATRAAALTGAGFLAWYLGDGARGRALLEESIALWREAGQMRGLADALAFLGAITREQNYARGTALAEESISIARTLGDPGLLGWTLWSFAFNANVEQADERARARAAGEEALALLRTTGDIFALGHTHRALARVAQYEGDYVRAWAGLEANVAAMHAVGDRHGAATGLGLLGDVARLQGEAQAAAAFYAESSALWRDLGLSGDLGIEQVLLPQMLRRLGDIALDQGDHGLAKTRYAESLAAARDMGDLGQIAEALGSLAAAEAQPARVLRLAGAAGRLRDEAGRPLSAAEDTALEQRLASARRALSLEEATAAWAEGQAMTLEQAVAYALKGPPPSTSGTTVDSG